MSNGERIIKNGDIEICTESFGNRQDSAVLLIMGATASMLWWEEEFCEKLAEKGRFIIRFDNRDVGRSTAEFTITRSWKVPGMNCIIMIGIK